MVKPGYKQTEIGVIPEDWDLILFEDCFSVPVSYTHLTLPTIA